jgi:hypothetical protein
MQGFNLFSMRVRPAIFRSCRYNEAQNIPAEMFTNFVTIYSITKLERTDGEISDR